MMRRGDVWWAHLRGPAGRRPVVLVSRNEVYASRSDVTVAPVTTRIRGLRVEVVLGPEDGMHRTCAVNVDGLVTIPKSRLQRFIATLSDEKLRAVNAAIRFALGL